MDVIFILKIFKAMVEVAGLAFIGQGVVAIFSGNKRDQNFIYVIFKIITNPVTKFARMVSPRFVPDRHIPFIAFGLMFWAWVVLIVGIAYAQQGVGN